MIVQWHGSVVMLVAGHPGRPTAGGIETLVFGIVFLAVGSPFAMNFRGALDRWDWTPRPIPRVLRKLPPWRWEEKLPSDRAVFRIVAIGFTLGGILCIPLGIYRIATGKL